MPFTDRFIKVPIKVYDVAQKELTGKEELEDSWLKFNPFELSNYKPSKDESVSDDPICHITLKNGYGTLVYMPVEELEKLLNDFDKK